MRYPSWQSEQANTRASPPLKGSRFCSARNALRSNARLPISALMLLLLSGNFGSKNVVTPTSGESHLEREEDKQISDSLPFSQGIR